MTLFVTIDGAIRLLEIDSQKLHGLVESIKDRKLYQVE